MIRAAHRRLGALAAGLAALGCVAGAWPAGAAPGGPLGTLPLGGYMCELPGDALGPTGNRQPDADFDIINASSYRTTAGSGVYLLTGRHLTFTSGPFNGIAYHRLGDGFLRRTLPDGTDGPLRCVRANANNRLLDSDERPTAPVIE